ncbi:NYN domain-containing protein [Hyphomicrobium methylovorum]|uniref:NYN domain-containing protein n=1 Tax=Hyphomicrobium methylovorum TaxID=84 RepID=UPI0015E7C082|nr:NYN domain-containing protein [Hyphomicrobium methylovorum]MBA2125751.1 NYN domain-containing protein [Hyphomicrobium methylovorum]
MKRESSGPVLTTVFVDYDNIYLSLKRKNEDAAKRFAKDCGVWLQGIASGELITSTSPFTAPTQRRIAMNRCYGNPVPRRNTHDNSTDMNSFPFIRHHFLRSGFEVIDCPPLTAQLKNSADIRIVMDVRDILNHETFFDEFIILSGDADFTPLLHRLRAHARRTVVFANDHTAQPYTAISDGEVRESDLLALLTSRAAISGESPREIAQAPQPAIDVEAARKAILGEVIDFVRNAPQAVPLETLADRSVRVVGRDKTIGTNWGGHGSFRDLLLADLPDDIHLSDTAPYTVFDGNRHISASGLIAPQLALPASEQNQREVPREPARPIERPVARETLPSVQKTMAPPQSPPQQARPQPAPQSAFHSTPQQQPQPQPQQRYSQPAQSAPPAPPMSSTRPQGHAPDRVPSAPNQNVAPRQQPQQASPSPYGSEPVRDPSRAAPQQTSLQPSAPTRSPDQATQIQQSIARIHEACQAPALAPAEYRVLFDVMAQELTANGLQGAQTLVNITQRAREFGLDIKRDDLRFIYDVVSESDPWFEQGSSAGLFASRFRNFVVARCRSQGLNLSVDELDLVEAWFSAPHQSAARAAPSYGRGNAAPQAPQQRAAPTSAAAPQSGDKWWNLEESRQHVAEQREAERANAYPQNQAEEEFPRIVRSRFRAS